MSAINAPYAHGQRVTANSQQHTCPNPACHSADMKLNKASSAEVGVYECLACGEGFLRLHADVTPVDGAPESGLYDTGPARLDTPQTPPSCPPWCILDHPETYSELASVSHISRPFMKYPAAGNAVTITQTWTNISGLRDVAIMIERPEKIGAVFLDAEEARTLADAVSAFNRRSLLAVGLRKAADELDRITGATS